MCSSLGCRRFVHVFSAEGDDDSAHQVAEGDDDDEDQSFHVVGSGGAEVEHVGDTVLESREDEDGDCEDGTEVLLFLLVVIGGDEHQHTAEHTLAEDPEVIGHGELGVNKVGDHVVGEGLGRHHVSADGASDEVTEDDDQEIEGESGFVVEKVPDLTGVEVETEGEDREETDAE